MTVETLFSLLAYALFLSVAYAVIYKRHGDCEELLMIVFSMFIVIALITILALMIDMPLLVALGVASLVGLQLFASAVTLYGGSSLSPLVCGTNTSQGAWDVLSLGTGSCP
jgi:uncharacterized membrane protein YoaK (UPF0700 family)